MLRENKSASRSAAISLAITNQLVTPVTGGGRVGDSQAVPRSRPPTSSARFGADNSRAGNLAAPTNRGDIGDTTALAKETPAWLIAWPGICC